MINDTFKNLITKEWPDQRSLVVSDFHSEAKGSWFELGC